ncbi:MAG: hypothetical protein LBB18_00615, partial [Puniceicoccales bacterium]|nr:hypothetical protein [Puniceicoccales bacterium]
MWGVVRSLSPAPVSSLTPESSITRRSASVDLEGFSYGKALKTNKQKILRLFSASGLGVSGPIIQSSMGKTGEDSLSIKGDEISNSRVVIQSSPIMVGNEFVPENDEISSSNDTLGGEIG